jgi:hypothetical protein
MLANSGEALKQILGATLGCAHTLCEWFSETKAYAGSGAQSPAATGEQNCTANSQRT